MTEQFEAGQTVWRKSDGKEFTASRLSDQDFLVVICDDKSIRAENYDDFTATDPNRPAEKLKQGYSKWTRPVQAYECPQCLKLHLKPGLCEECMPSDTTPKTANQPAEPVPQACPFCGGKTNLAGCGPCRMFCMGEDCIMGPIKPTRLEAIAAWNSISVTPPKEPEPKNCPLCGKKPIIHQTDFGGVAFDVLCNGGGFWCLRGPQLPTRAEAVAVWNKLGGESLTNPLDVACGGG